MFFLLYRQQKEIQGHSTPFTFKNVWTMHGWMECWCITTSLGFAAFTYSCMFSGWCWLNKLGESGPDDWQSSVTMQGVIFFLVHKTVTSLRSRLQWVHIHGWRLRSGLLCAHRLCSWGTGVSTVLSPNQGWNISCLSEFMVVLVVALSSGVRGETFRHCCSHLL